MRCRVERPDGSSYDDDRVPVCGEDFCDTCGDCLVCYSDDPCPGYGSHSWVIYVGEDDES